ADAYDSVEASTEYAQNVARLMDLLRAALRADDLPVVLGRIQDSGDTPDTQVMAYSAEVRAQQEAYAASDPCAAIVTVTEAFGFLPDGWHYRSEDYLTLGEAFADAVVQLQPACGPNAAR
ncbi:MAG: sialate O-acetylesterase, partial [Pseudomonadota bacterium]